MKMNENIRPQQNVDPWIAIFDGEIAKMIGEYDWGQSALGPMTLWPASFKSAVCLILSSTVPMALIWGEDLLFLGNTAWYEVFTNEQLGRLGDSVQNACPELWNAFAEDISRIMSGDCTRMGHELNLDPGIGEKADERNLRKYTLSPIYDADNTIGGIFISSYRVSDRRQPVNDQSRLLAERTAVMENLVEALTLADLSGNIIYHNPASLNLHGYATFDEAQLPKSAYSETWEIRDLRGRSVPIKNWPMPRALRDEHFTDYQLSVRRRDNDHTFIGSYSGTLVKDKTGKPLFAMLTIRDISQQKKAEIALHNERELLQTIFDRIPVMLSVYDPKLEKITLNKHVERVTGWTEKDTEQKSIMELVYPDPDYRREMAAYMQSLKPGFKDILMTTKDGSTVETSWANVQIPDGRQVGIGINMSERVKVERALQQYSARLQFLHEVDEAILAARSENEIAYAVVVHIPELVTGCIQASVTVTDLEYERISLKACSPIASEAQQQSWPFPQSKLWQSFLESLQAGESYSMVVEKSNPVLPPFIEHLAEHGIRNLLLYPILINGQLAGSLNLGMKTDQPLTPEQNEIVRELLVPLSIGIEQTRLHAKALEINRRLLETVINNIPVAVSLIRGSDQRILYANPIYYDISPGKTLIGKTLDEVWGENDYDYASICQKVLDSGQPFILEDDEISINRSPDGTPEKAYFSWWLFPVDIPDEPEPGILNMAYETTDRKMAEAALVEAERLTTIGRMATSLAHEINNPIQSVVGCMGLAMESLEDCDDARKFMEVAMEELIRASQIVHRMRDMARSGNDEKSFGCVDELLEKVLLLTQKQAEDQNVEVVWKREANPPDLLMSSDKIRQVFLNLVLNAIEAMPEGGKLVLETHRVNNPDGVQIVFEDTGVGIPQNDLDNLFNAFHSTKQLGLGLGLYVSQQIIEDHGGKIAVESAVGQGSKFTLWLPFK